jgi:transcriptional regulator with XRE-family HTH domain
MNTGEQKSEEFRRTYRRPAQGVGLTQTELAGRIKGRSGETISQQRITDIEHDRFGVPRRPILKQLARALELDIDVPYLWGRVIPSDIRAEGLWEDATLSRCKKYRKCSITKVEA